jgi:hypothetical protein
MGIKALVWGNRIFEPEFLHIIYLLNLSKGSICLDGSIYVNV